MHSETFMNALQEYGARNEAAGKTGELVDARGQETTGQQSEDAETRHSRKEEPNTNSLKEVGEDSEGKKLTADQIEYFKDSKIVDDEGRLLKVYHGTSEDFTVFDRNKGRSTMDIQGSFFSPWEIDAGGYGENVQSYYLNLKNPAPEGVAYKALNRFKGQNDAGVKAREYLESQGYDGVNNGDEEYIAFYPEQIKLVTNEHPTEDVDIRFSKKQIGPDGIEEYSTSAVVKAMSEGQRNKKIEELMASEYEGKTVKFWKKGRAYYALLDDHKNNDPVWKKSVYGDNKSDPQGRAAKKRVSAEGDYIELLEGAKYTGTSKEQGKTTRSGIHKRTKTWDYFHKKVRIDGVLYDVIINISDQGYDQYVYDVTLKRKPNQKGQNTSGLGSAPKPNITPSNGKSNNNLPTHSKKELDEIDEVFEAEAQRLGDVGFMDIIRQIDMKEVDQYFKISTARKVAKELIDEYSSSMKAADLAAMIQATFAHWAKQGNKVDLTDIVKSMVGIARPLTLSTYSRILVGFR